MGNAWQTEWIAFLGGLAFFLFGIRYFGKQLGHLSGSAARNALRAVAGSPLACIASAAGATLLLRSSSIVSVFIVLLAAAGLFTLRQSLLAIVGCHIGTAGSVLFAHTEGLPLATGLLVAGLFAMLLTHSSRASAYAELLFSAGVIWFGLEWMTHQALELLGAPLLQQFSASARAGVLHSVGVGAGATAMIQSSGATVGMLQQLCTDGLLTMPQALPILLGDNVGTTITALVAAVGLAPNAKRVASFHALSNLAGAGLFLAASTPFLIYVEWLTDLWGLAPDAQVAMAHLSFNVLNSFIQATALALWIKLLARLIKGEGSPAGFPPLHLDAAMIRESPSIAIGQAKEEILRMGAYSVRSLENALLFTKQPKRQYALEMQEIDREIGALDRSIAEYLMRISHCSLSESDAFRHLTLVEALGDIERISDRARKLLALQQYRHKENLSIADEAQAELLEMFELAILVARKALHALDENSIDCAREVAVLEGRINEMERALRKRQLSRQCTGACSAPSGTVFVDTIGHLESIGVHSLSIADAVLGRR